MRQAHGLADRIRDGDRAAERELVLRYERPVRCLILARSGSREVARDLTQEVLLQAIRALRADRLRDVEHLAAFVHGIARNLVANHHRSTAQAAEVPLESEAHQPVATQDSLEVTERMGLVRRALAGVSLADQTILTLMLVDGLSLASVGARLGLRPAAVRQRKSRAIKRIRETIRTQDGARGGT